MIAPTIVTYLYNCLLRQQEPESCELSPSGTRWGTRIAVGRSMIAIAVIVNSLVMTSTVLAQAGSVTRPDASKKSDVKLAGKMAAKQVALPVDEKTALQFAADHHSELAELLQSLRKSNKQQFNAAIGDLARECDRLERLRERDPERAKLAINSWKVDSRIRLELARFSMTQDLEREARIRELLKERADVKFRLLELDHRRTKQRLAKLDEQLQQSQLNATDERLAAEFDRLKKAVAGQSRSKPVRAETTKRKDAPSSSSTKNLTSP